MQEWASSPGTCLIRPKTKLLFLYYKELKNSCPERGKEGKEGTGPLCVKTSYSPGVIKSLS
jgi:hypothetical protein